MKIFTCAALTIYFSHRYKMKNISLKTNGKKIFGLRQLPPLVGKIDTPPLQERKLHPPPGFLTLSTGEQDALWLLRNCIEQWQSAFCMKSVGKITKDRIGKEFCYFFSLMHFFASFLRTAEIFCATKDLKKLSQLNLPAIQKKLFKEAFYLLTYAEQPVFSFYQNSSKMFGSRTEHVVRERRQSDIWTAR